MNPDAITRNRPAIYLLSLKSVAISIFLLFSSISYSAELDEQNIKAMEWRNIGPFRGGRVTAVEGVPSQAQTFYMGAAGGGVWRTTDGGVSWGNISDGFFNTGSVGAIAVSLSDPNVIYAGMGEHCVRDVTVSHGDGVYKSTDNGKSWSHVGLEKTLHISSVQVHPDNPEIVYVGAQGSPWGSHAERGVYRSLDGGESWSLILHANETSGINDLVMDPHNPRILYAAMWDHSRKPWHGYQMHSGGPGSALYKSTDGGDSWKKLTKGLPDSVGKFGISVSAADSQRIYALVEAKPGLSGVYVSNDAGESWSQKNSDHVVTQRTAYYMHIVADPVDLDVVYVLNAPFLKSIDGGKTFERLAVPHGDNHDLWIHPENSEWMIEANDGGVNVSYNGGATWSSQGNQPTAQFYRLNADNLFPYNLYGGQQDNTTVKIRSRSTRVGIGEKDWYPVGGGESAHVAFDPDNPRLIYAGNYQGQITEFDDSTGLVRDIRRYPLGAAYRRPEEYPYRFNWNAPIVVSKHDSSVIYHAAQMVLKSVDAGQSWMEISPDLTRNEKQKQGIVEGEFTFEGTAGAMYNTIFYIAESTFDDKELWVGTDDGLIHLTRDGGTNWESITPKGLGEVLINMIELSPHQAGKAYAVVSKYKFDDRSPLIYKTEDFGRSWEQIAESLPSHSWVRVVREDPQREGLLYAGSQTAIHYSLDGGENWSSMQLNLPHVPVTDLKVHENDLLASTEGRAFWILDDLSPIRQLNVDDEKQEMLLYEPAASEQTYSRRFGRSDGLGKNPPTGSTIYYTLSEELAASDEPITLEIFTEQGDLVNTFIVGEEEKGPSLESGLNRFVWNWHVKALEKNSPELKSYRGAFSHRVTPGAYKVKLTSGDEVASKDFLVEADPRLEYAAQAVQQKKELLGDLYAEAAWLLNAVEELGELRDSASSVNKLMNSTASDEFVSAYDALNQKIDHWLETVIEESNEHFVDAGHSPGRLDFALFEVLNMVDVANPPLSQGLEHRVSDVRMRWTQSRDDFNKLKTAELASFNTAVAGHSIPPLTIAD